MTRNRRCVDMGPRIDQDYPLRHPKLSRDMLRYPESSKDIPVMSLHISGYLFKSRDM